MSDKPTIEARMDALDLDGDGRCRTGAAASLAREYANDRARPLRMALRDLLEDSDDFDARARAARALEQEMEEVRRV